MKRVKLATAVGLISPTEVDHCHDLEVDLDLDVIRARDVIPVPGRDTEVDLTRVDTVGLILARRHCPKVRRATTKSSTAFVKID